MAESVDMETLIGALNRVADRISGKYWEVSPAEALRTLALELEYMGKNLDPLPFIHTVADQRMPAGSRHFYHAEVLRFAPREEFEQDEKEYPSDVRAY